MLLNVEEEKCRKNCRNLRKFLRKLKIKFYTDSEMIQNVLPNKFRVKKSAPERLTAGDDCISEISLHLYLRFLCLEISSTC